MLTRQDGMTKKPGFGKQTAKSTDSCPYPSICPDSEMVKLKFNWSLGGCRGDPITRTFRFTACGPSIAGAGIEHGWKIGTCERYTHKTNRLPLKNNGWKTIRSLAVWLHKAFSSGWRTQGGATQGVPRQLRCLPDTSLFCLFVLGCEALFACLVCCHVSCCWSFCLGL